MAAAAAPSPPAGLMPVRPPRERTGSWPLIDRVCYGLCWVAGAMLCLIAASVVLYMLVKGLSYLKPKLFVTSPAASLNQATSGGFSDPIVGTLIVTAIGIVIAAPL
ncbi:MAG TPA: ABC transporter permease, partial [Solirubrobacteraceae bacterium]